MPNGTVVDDAIRFAASYAVSTTTEKANSDERVTVDEDVSSSNDIQGSKENRSYKQQSQQQQTILFSIRVWNKPFWIRDDSMDLKVNS